MVDIDIIYKFVDISKKTKETNEEDEQKYHCHCSLSTEEDLKLTREKIEQLLKSDDVEIPKEATIKYKLKNDDENQIEQGFKELKEPYEDLKLIPKTKLDLNLEIYIDMASYLAELEKKEKNKDKEEEIEIKKQNEEAESILKELSEMRKQIKNMEILNDRNNLNLKQKSNIHGTVITINQKEQNLNNSVIDNQKMNPKTTKDILLNTSTCVGKTNSTKNKKEIKNNNIYFFYSYPKDPKDKCKEDFSFYDQWLYIYRKIKKHNKKKDKPEIKIYLKQIITNLFREESPIILHIRVDSFLNPNNVDEVYFHYCDNDFRPSPYKFEDLFKENVFKDLKILIISSDNIDKIKNKIDKIENLKNVIKIYIYHPNTPNYDYYKSENEIIKNFYDYLLESQSIKIKDIFGNNNKLFQITYNKDIENIENIFEEKKLETNNFTEKNLLKYDMILDSYYPIIGRENEFFSYLEKQLNEISVCICGDDQEELKFFVKKIGFSLYERIPKCKVYFLEIYENEIKPNERIYKIDLLFDEICQNNNEGIIYLIIFLNGINNLQEIKNEINLERIPNEGDLSINYLYAYSYKDKKENNETSIIKLNEFLGCKEDEIESLINYYLLNQKIELKIIDKLILNIKKKKSSLTIQNLFLLPIYLKLLSQKEFNNNDDEIKIEELEELFFKDNKEDFVKKILEILNKKLYINDKENKKIYDMLCYLFILKYGISKSFLGRLWLNNDQKMALIEKNLIGLIVIENIENEKIYRLNTSFRKIIGSILNQENILTNEKFENILKTYQKIFRQMMPSDYNKITTFNATTKNEFWFTKKSKENYEKAIKEDEDEGDTNYILNEGIDSNNIIYLISKLKDRKILYDNSLFPYIEDISITLPSLLNYNRSDIYTEKVIKFFEVIFDCNFKQFNKNFEYNIKALNIRLGIFEYWYTQRFECFTRALERIGIKSKNNYAQLEQLNFETKIECCLIQIYDNIKKKDKNIKKLQDEFNEYIKKINDKNEKNNYIIRFKALCAQCSNSIEEIENLLNIKDNEYIKDLTYIKDDILINISRYKFYFYLQDSLGNKNHINYIDVTNNFYLTQKLLEKSFFFELKYSNYN